MKSDVQDIYKLFVDEEFNGLLDGLNEVKKCNFIIFDDEGYLLNGRWSNKSYSKQLPGIRKIKHEYYAIYDTRYCKTQNIVKMYSEFMHEIFHCYHIKRDIDLRRMDIVEGSALLFEMIVYSKYVDVTIEKLLNDYGSIMTNEKYHNYYFGAKEAYKKLLNGESWEKILNGNRAK